VARHQGKRATSPPAEKVLWISPLQGSSGENGFNRNPARKPEQTSPSSVTFLKFTDLETVDEVGTPALERRHS